MGGKDAMPSVEDWKKTIEGKHSGAVLSCADRFGTPEIRIDPKVLPAVVQTLRDGEDSAMEMLVDLVALDYSEYPAWTGPRFGLIYHLKSLSRGHRLTLKVLLEGETPSITTISPLYKNADWLEREAWDQMGVVFTNHPDLRRLLNHHEFVGHPLRKDYPITRRQALTVTDPMTEPLQARLKEKGWS
jgi:NADH-quinone oxidoreductase subunit C